MAEDVSCAEHHDTLAGLGDSGIHHIPSPLNGDSFSIRTVTSVCQMKDPSCATHGLADLSRVQEINARHVYREARHFRAGTIVAHRDDYAPWCLTCESSD